MKKGLCQLRQSWKRSIKLEMRLELEEVYLHFLEMDLQWRLALNSQL
jgi:hypothetical protein